MLSLLWNLFQIVWDHVLYPLDREAVPDERTALEIGKAVLRVEYLVDIDDISFEVCYLVSKKAWYISEQMKTNRVGGAGGVVIRKCDGKVLGFKRFM